MPPEVGKAAQELEARKVLGLGRYVVDYITVYWEGPGMYVRPGYEDEHIYVRQDLHEHYIGTPVHPDTPRKFHNTRPASGEELAA